MRILFGLTFVAFLGLTGCGREPAKSHITGEVTLDGSTVDEGSISFLPSDGEGPTAGGQIENGTYSVDVPPGPKKVSITSSEVVGQRKAYETEPNSPMIDIVRERIPTKYNAQTELTYDVPSGSDEKNFELKSK
jgi:hypothetical protein